MRRLNEACALFQARVIWLYPKEKLRNLFVICAGRTMRLRAQSPLSAKIVVKQNCRTTYAPHAATIAAARLSNPSRPSNGRG